MVKNKNKKGSFRFLTPKTWGHGIVIYYIEFTLVRLSSCPQGRPTYLVLGSPVQSGLLSNFDKTKTWTGPHKSTNLEKLDWTKVNRFSAVFVSFLWLKDQSQMVCTGVWGIGSTLTVVPTVNKIYMKTNYIMLWAPACKAPPLTESTTMTNGDNVAVCHLVTMAGHSPWWHCLVVALHCGGVMSCQSL